MRSGAWGLCKVHETCEGWEQVHEVGARCIGLVYGGIMCMRLVQGAWGRFRVGSGA